MSLGINHNGYLKVIDESFLLLSILLVMILGIVK